jgi:hypothetical protein
VPMDQIIKTDTIQHASIDTLSEPLGP